MSGQNLQILQFLFVQNWKPLDEAGVITENKFANCPEIVTHLQSDERPGLILCSLGSKKDLMQIATLLKIAKKLNRESGLKLAVVNFSGSKQFEVALQKLGILDIIDPTINAKGLKFKLNLWIKNLTASANKSAFQMKSLKAAEGQKQNEKKVVESNSTFLPAMTTPDDIWLHLKEFECKRILGRWLIRLMGPSPYVAQWVEVPNKPGVWRFEFREGQKQDFLSGEGNWFFKGDQKPDFNWKENIWYFAGDTIDLFYFDAEVLPRLQLKDRQLAICENSPAALKKEEAIRNSFDKDLVFKKDVERLSDLEGKGGADDLDQDAIHASGAEGDAEAEGDLKGNLKGKSETSKSAGHLRSRDAGSDDVIENTPEATRAKEEREREQQSGNLQGKSKTDHLEQNDLKGNNKDEETKRRESPFASRAPQESPESTSEDGKPKLAAKVDREQSRPAKEAAESLREEDKGGSYAGKSSTDNHGKNHYGSKKKDGPEASESDDPRAAHESLSAEASDLHGKGKTDHVNRPNLQGKTKSEGDVGVDPLSLKLKEQEKSGPGFSSMKSGTDELRDLGGKGKTDHLTQKDLSGKNKGEGDIGTDPLALKLNEGNEKKGNLGGKSSTDHLDSLGKKGPGAGAHRDGEQQDYDNKNHTHETKYKGHLEAEKFDAKEDRKNQYREDEQDGYMGGGHGTSHLKKNYGSKEDSAVGTDKLDRSALGAKLSKKEEEERARSPHLSKPTPEGKASGASESDEDLDFSETTDGNVLPFKKPEFDAAALADLKESLHNPETEAQDLLQTAILKAKIVKGSREEACKFDDFFDGLMMFELSSETEYRDDVGVNLELDYDGKIVNLSLKGTVTSSESHSGSTYLSVQVEEKENPDFPEFLEVFETRQRHITEFLMKVKGL